MPRAKDELQELAKPFGFQVHYNSNKIWVNRIVLGGRFSKCFTDYGKGGESLRKYVADWIKRWGPAFQALYSSASDESGPASSFTMGFKEKE